MSIEASLSIEAGREAAFQYILKSYKRHNFRSIYLLIRPEFADWLRKQGLPDNIVIIGGPEAITRCPHAEHLIITYIP